MLLTGKRRVQGSPNWYSAIQNAWFYDAAKHFHAKCEACALHLQALGTHHPPVEHIKWIVDLYYQWVRSPSSISGWILGKKSFSEIFSERSSPPSVILWFINCLYFHCTWAQLAPAGDASSDVLLKHYTGAVSSATHKPRGDSTSISDLLLCCFPWLFHHRAPRVEIKQCSAIPPLPWLCCSLS